MFGCCETDMKVDRHREQSWRVGVINTERLCVYLHREIQRERYSLYWRVERKAQYTKTWEGKTKTKVSMMGKLNKFKSIKVFCCPFFSSLCLTSYWRHCREPGDRWIDIYISRLSAFFQSKERLWCVEEQITVDLSVCLRLASLASPLRLCNSCWLSKLGQRCDILFSGCTYLCTSHIHPCQQYIIRHILCLLL